MTELTPAEASRRITELVQAGSLRQAYYDGHQDGALSMLAPALGLGESAHQLMGRRFRITIEWLDPIDDDQLAIARHMAERAQQRAQERL